MSIAIKSEQGDLILFDVVSRYTRGFQSQVTQHPVDGSGVISDHVINQNPTIQITGFITAADFNSGKPNILTENDQKTLGLDSIVVAGSVANIVEIDYEQNATNFLPDVAGQFFSESFPEIKNISEGRIAEGDLTQGRGTEKDILKALQLYRDIKARLTLYEFDTLDGIQQIVEEIPASPAQAAFITGLSAAESAENGDALAFNITFEIVTISTLIEEEIPENLGREVQEQGAEQNNKGVQQGEEAEVRDVESEASLASGLLTGSETEVGGD